jgi:tetratricopeptide (TPR) repeat protein
MRSAVIRRYIYFSGIGLLVLSGLWIVLAPGREPGDFHTQMGDNRLSSGRYDEALVLFDKALDETPDHRGALMGRALVFIHTERDDEAIEALTYLIDSLDRTLQDHDRTGRGALAAAYANRGIVHDRRGQHELALQDYRQALGADPAALKGPRLWHRILYGNPRPSTVAQRAAYLTEQLRLPEDERVLLIPEIDAQQRTHKP